MNKTTRISELDSLRGIAALAVVLFHYTTKYSEIFHTDITIKAFSFKNGHYGVQLFFIISGFVIFMTINKVKTSIDFLFKRFIRLFPVFWICMIITFTITSIFPPGFERGFTDVLINFTMIPSLLGAKPIDGAYWSLIPELFFYGLMFFVLISKLKSKIVLIGFVWILLIFINTLFDIPTIIQIILNLKYGLMFLVGMNFYEIYLDKSKFINHLQIVTCVLISFFMEDAIFPYYFILFVSIFYFFVYQKLTYLAIKPLVFFGEISYALYLLHQFVGYTIQYNLIKELGVTSSWVLILIPLLVVVILSYFVTFLIERPIIKKGNELYKKYNTKVIL